MHILLANHSSYPASAEAASGHAAIDAAIHAQERAGLDVVTDGHAGMPGAVMHFFSHIDGVRFEGSQRSVDAATSPPPVIEGRLRRRAPHPADECRCALLSARAVVKAVIPGPYTLARLARRATTAYLTVAALATDCAGLLAEDIRLLVGGGVRMIQIDEPQILLYPADVRLSRELLEPLQSAAGDGCEIVVSTYAADAAPLYAQLHSLPADVVALDLVCGQGLIDTIADTGAGKMLALGVVDGRSPQLESADTLARLLARALHRYVHERIYLQPSCGLGSLTPAQAWAKLDVLRAARSRFLGKAGG